MNNTANAPAKFQYGRFGLTTNPRGAHVALTLGGRELLGEVTGYRRDETVGAIRLTVRHFCGELWPIEPVASAVTVFVRR